MPRGEVGGGHQGLGVSGRHKGGVWGADPRGRGAVMALLQNQERNWFSIDYEDDSGLREVEVVGVSELLAQTRTVGDRSHSFVPL